ncbi:30S ribosomal protein S7 [Candidatus Roizmanbacteria bacterium CG2_30_33_16]|uniref:Small ribosomal subunit protein uS7 n=5 Tax=Candidatus Roizmaniibacteriota TaxID=1752723 RepID=A0A2M7E4S5_9BACT|nr:30S ribosomal protein S7 [Candidatus Roizmanbacteria bacterium]OIP82184.1 MAG: 30S ribosomal protein S7 [Candidatus Roizmanbacteria bacterium CG2_30_33_16]PIP64156.1 MAG: 30S ribosomal protein S7 [Candidatus Roizmanbacteria bacterium CG22_combo_CG10-13_8_21_14_all_33_16]PIV62737.1 MAG: 30S ribosomal protein S7 [Candidatus Roizmanbacteria bacterium CG01_land_8_20_14_3_00_33_9]PIX70628.1 MAG: 30S ribosomal protein S7 [Candidatus Roizmanbacteria bacterium CG_4_10_14_3_um_filter_33_21]PJB87899.
MPRRNFKRIPTKSDPIYKSLEIAKLINYVMIDGKKSVAQSIVYGLIEKLKKDSENPLETLTKAISNVAPIHEVKPRRLGGASYLVPIEVRKERRLFLALNWIVNAAKTRSNKEFHTFSEKLYAEIKEASQQQGAAFAKKTQTEKLADANRAFSHLKW